MRRTSLKNFHNEGLIYFHSANHWFNPFTLDCGDFWRRFLLVKPHTLATHFLLSPYWFFLIVLGFFSEVLIQAPFYQTAHSYCTKPCSISSDEMVMKEEMKSWFQGLGYKDKFNPGEVPYTYLRKRQIDTRTILSAISQEEGRKFFGEGRVFVFFTCMIVFFK